SLDAVVSPHAHEADLRDFGGCPAWRDVEEALDGMRPELLIIAAATEAHVELARLAIARGIPALVEKPLARTEEEAVALVREVEEKGALLAPAHNSLHVAGLDAVLAASGRGGATSGSRGDLSLIRRRTATSPDVPRLWSRAYLQESLYHALV